MDGMFIKREKVDLLTQGSKSDLFLLLDKKDLEIMLQVIYKDSLIWITPAADKSVIEFFYIIKGSLTLEYDDKSVTLGENDCVYTSDLKGKVLLKSNTDLKVLDVTNGPVYQFLENFYEELNLLLDKITEKDEYTKHHCRRVANYCLFISKKLKCAEKISDEIVVASLFHDVGKCFIPMIS
jgi:HD-GYP domain-containing protein (c-di-GMP phosphodiesterase class II)